MFSDFKSWMGHHCRFQTQKGRALNRHEASQKKKPQRSVKRQPVDEWFRFDCACLTSIECLVLVTSTLSNTSMRMITR